MKISLIVAMDRHGLIGTDTGLPWRLPRDLQRFKSLTMGKPILMGRTTYQHIGRPLPGRLNIVLTRDRTFTAPGCEVAHTLAEGLEAARRYLSTTDGDEAFIIGGAQVYREAMPLWDRLYLTIVEGDFTGTAYFPQEELRQLSGHVIQKETWPADEKNPHAHTFYVMERGVDPPGIEPGFPVCETGVFPLDDRPEE